MATCGKLTDKEVASNAFKMTKLLLMATVTVVIITERNIQRF